MADTITTAGDTNCMQERIIATIIDTVILVVGSFVLILVLPPFIVVFPGLAYYIVMEALTAQTVGKMAMKIKVVRIDGQPMDWQVSFLRNILRIVDGILFYLVGFLIANNNPNKQRLGDQVAKTLVVKAEA
jgi:uncharacterized RDD family membrane protein YckC